MRAPPGPGGGRARRGSRNDVGRVDGLLLQRRSRHERLLHRGGARSAAPGDHRVSSPVGRSREPGESEGARGEADRSGQVLAALRVPTLAADDPATSPKFGCCQWNGAVWLEWNYLVFSARRYGYEEIAGELGERMVEAAAAQLSGTTASGNPTVPTRSRSPRLRATSGLHPGESPHRSPPMNALALVLLAAATVPRFERPVSPIVLEGPARPAAYLEASGRRAAFLGREDGSFEAWVYPMKILRGFELAFEIEDYASPIPGASLASRVDVRPEASTIRYVHSSFTADATWLVLSRVGRSVRSTSTPRGPHVEARFRTEMRLCGRRASAVQLLGPGASRLRHHREHAPSCRDRGRRWRPTLRAAGAQPSRRPTVMKIPISTRPRPRVWCRSRSPRATRVSTEPARRTGVFSKRPIALPGYGRTTSV
jgi:hypothetical protein